MYLLALPDMKMKRWNEVSASMIYYYNGAVYCNWKLHSVCGHKIS